MRYIIKNYELSESVCVQFVCKIVVKLWANIMLHWPTSNCPNSKHETRLPLDQCIVLAEIQHPHKPAVDVLTLGQRTPVEIGYQLVTVKSDLKKYYSLSQHFAIYITACDDL